MDSQYEKKNFISETFKNETQNKKLILKVSRRKHMGLRINTNVASMNTLSTLSGNKGKLDMAMNRLSSGSKINRASDDAAGLAISEGIKARLRGLKQSDRNAQDGISLIQIAEGGLNEVSNILIRLRELGIQSASDTISDRERKLVNIEYSQMLDEVDRIAGTTSFNGTNLLSGETQKLDFQINTRNSELADRISFDGTTADIRTQSLGLSLANVADKFSAQESLAMVDAAIQNVAGIRSNFGAIQSRLNSTVENLQQSVENNSIANSRIRDTDVAEESTNLAKQNILMQTGTAILAQSNQQGQLAMQLMRQS
jgi:flagellin